MGLPALTAQSPLQDEGQIRDWDTILTGIVAQDHWIALCWQKRAGQVHAWSSHCSPAHEEAISVADWIASKLMGEHVGSFLFLPRPMRPPLPSKCGHFAIVDLCSHLRGEPFLQDREALAAADSLLAGFLQPTLPDAAVAFPWCVAGGATDMVEHTDLAKSRAQAAIKA